MSHARSTRRKFLKASTSVVGGALAPYWLSGAVAQAEPIQAGSDRPHIGAIGVGGRGSAVLAQAAVFGEVVAVCDVDRTHAERAREKHGGKATIYDDYRLFGEDCPDEIKSFDRDGIMFIGDKGRVFVNRGGVYGKAVEELTENPLPEGSWRVPPSRDHMGNFFECVKSRQEPISPVRIQHRTISACHLTNISIRLGRKLAWDPATQQIVGDPEANTWQQREQRSGYQLHT
ncbi:MAG: twin-arginine translocation signal domain-containing protein [Pirellulaceae bacterium]|nr:twin-arginine translocation signal domain-containing protein [Pirellulaceae bacterium]